MQATTDIVSAFVRLNEQTQSFALKDDMFRTCQRFQTEVFTHHFSNLPKLTTFKNSALRSELSLVRSQLKDAQTQKERYRDGLVSAEKRIDRLQSKTLATLQPQTQEPEVKSVEPEVKDESPRPRETPSSPVVSGPVNWWEFRPVSDPGCSPLT